MLTDKEIKDYQSIHRNVFQTEVSTEDAREQGIKLIVLFEAIFRPSS